MKEIPLSLTKDYCKSWGVWQAVRELITNALDTGEYYITFDKNEGTICIESYGGEIPINCLLMGEGSKKMGDDNIGMHGEGSAIAYLVLCREGKSVFVNNGTYTWEPLIKEDAMFGKELLHMRVEENPSYGREKVTINISGLTVGEVEECDRNYLRKDNIGEVFEGEQGQALLDPQYSGKVFCGGVYVTTHGGLLKGYNFKPSHLKLDRDRQTVRSFDIEWITKDLLAQMAREGERTAEVLEMVVAKSNDVNHIDSVYSAPLRDASFDHYMKEHQGKVLASSYDEEKKLKASGVSNVINLGNSNLTSLIVASEGYKTFHMSNVITTKSVEELFLEYRDKHSCDMCLEALDDYDVLCQDVRTLTD